jgi:hypothetical protein
MELLARWVTELNPLATKTSQHTTQKWWAEQVDEVRSQTVDGKGSVRVRVRRASKKRRVARHNAFHDAFFAVCF